MIQIKNAFVLFIFPLPNMKYFATLQCWKKEAILEKKNNFCVTFRTKRSWLFSVCSWWECVQKKKNTIKMEKKNTNSEKYIYIKRKTCCICFVCLFVRCYKKNYWHWNKWTKNKKYIFYSVYMEIKIPICCIALLYKSKMCLWLFFLI